MFIKLKRKIANKLLSYLFNVVTEDDILVHDKKNRIVLQGNDVISFKKIERLQSEIKTIRDLEWWDIMNKEMKYRANKKMFDNAKEVDDIIFGKAVLYTLDIMEQSMNKFLRYK